MEYEPQILTRLRRKVLKKFAIFVFGIFLLYAGYIVIVGLQTSINIEDGVGAASVTATYVTATLFGVIVTPVLLRQFGTKTCIIFSEVTYLIYILVNYYPSAYTLIPAGVIVGMGEATLWPVMTLFCVYYARSFSRYGKREASSYVVEFLGLFYFIYMFSGVFGSLIGYAILYGGKSPIPTENDTSSTSSTPVVRDLSVCGRNDCQDPNITIENINNYVPASRTLINILIGVMAGLVVGAMFIHGFFAKNVADLSEDFSEIGNSNEKSIEENSSTQHETSAVKSVLLTIKQTALHLINPKQLLITPFALYSGLVTSFGFVEITRAYGSCVIGIESIGLLAALGLTCDAFSAYFSCKLSSVTGRHVPMLLGFVIDIANYMFLFFWIPSASTSWLVYIVFMLNGVIDGIWAPLINEMHSSYFPEEEDIALSVWNMYTLLAIVWQSAWSTSLCVYEKIYGLIAMLCFSIVCYGISQYVYYRKSPQHASEKSLETTTVTKL